MVVYVVFFNNSNGDDEYCGLFSSEEKAVEYIKRFSKDEQSSFRIEEVTFDVMLWFVKFCKGDWLVPFEELTCTTSKTTKGNRKWKT